MKIKKIGKEKIKKIKAFTDFCGEDKDITIKISLKELALITRILEDIDENELAKNFDFDYFNGYVCDSGEIETKEELKKDFSKLRQDLGDELNYLMSKIVLW